MRQTEHCDAVDDAEVGTFCLRTLVARYTVKTLLVYLRSRCCVYVVALAERLNHVGVVAEMRHDAQLYLTVISGEEQTARLGNETAAYVLAVLAAHGYVLQVRVARREASRGRYGLVERRVYVSRAWVYQLRKRVYVSAE